MKATRRLRAAASLLAFLGLGGCSQMGGCGAPPAEQSPSLSASAPVSPSAPGAGALSSPADMSGSAGGAAKPSRFDSAPSGAPGHALADAAASRPGESAALQAQGLLARALPAARVEVSELPAAARALELPDAEAPAALAFARPEKTGGWRPVEIAGGLLGLLLLLAAAWLLGKHSSQEAPALLRGQYRIVRPIGEGGMGVVYEGNDLSLQRKVAIKRMREDLRREPRERRRFLDEARLVASLHHPNIVDIYSIVEEGDDVYLIFEHIDGRTLSQLLAEEGKLRLADAAALLRGVADALDFAHSRGVIHRDLKPSNVMVDALGRARVMDFGIARAAKDALTRQAMTNTIVGTPPYMAPEQEQGAVRRESDVYALGVCLYELVTGALPFSGTGAGMLFSKMNGAFLPASTLGAGLPAGLDAVLARALEPRPEKRFPTAAGLIAALGPLLGTKP